VSGGYLVDSHQRYVSLVQELAAVRESIEQALGAVAEAEMFALSKRFPTRRIEFHSGMGSTQIEIRKRQPDHSNPYDNWNYCGEAGTSDRDWPSWVEIPVPDLWSAIRAYEDEVSDKGADPGIGCIIYENGVRLKGLGKP
jgi:hypothetical protein